MSDLTIDFYETTKVVARFEAATFFEKPETRGEPLPHNHMQFIN
jgi:hypothetical protein